MTLALRRAELHLAFDSSSLIASNVETPIERRKAEVAVKISGRQARPRACSMSRVCSATRPHVSLARYCARQRARDAARLSLGANTRARASERAGGAGASGSPHRTDRACGGRQGRHAGRRVLCTKGARHSQSAWALCAAANLLAVHPPRDGVLVCTYAHTHNIYTRRACSRRCAASAPSCCTRTFEDSPRRAPRAICARTVPAPGSNAFMNT